MLTIEMPKDSSPLHFHAEDAGAGFMVDEGSAIVRLLAVNFTDGAGEDLQALAEATVVWGQLIEEWLGALGRCARPWTPLSNRPALLFTNDPSENRVRGHGAMITVFPAGGPSANPAVVANAFAHAALGQRPPLSWQFLVAAQRHEISGDHRRAILDTATAVEVALSTALRIRLDRAGLGERTVEKLLSGGIDRLAELYRSEIGDLPVGRDAIAKTICHPRNSAIHKGTLPSHPPTRNAIRTARDLLAELEPIGKDAALTPPPSTPLT